MATFSTSVITSSSVAVDGLVNINGTALLGTDPKTALLIPIVTFSLGVFGNGLGIVSLLMYKYRKSRPQSPVTYSSGAQPPPGLPTPANCVCQANNDFQRRRSSFGARNKTDVVGFATKRRIRKQKFGPFHTLVLGLLSVNLLGNLVTAPLTLYLYSSDTTIMVAGGQALCNYSAFAMMYLGIVTMTSLMTMAIERVLSIQYAYYYHRHVTQRKAMFAILIVLLGCALFSALPVVGFGKVRPMFPGTWCFADWHAEETKDKAFNYIYATSGILMIFTTVICNVTVVVGLFRMKQRLRSRSTRKNSLRRETQMIIQLIVMTCIYLVCWLPLMIRILVNQITYKINGEHDRIAIWLAVANPILDPWVYILLRRSVLKRLLQLAKSICFSEARCRLRAMIEGVWGKSQGDFQEKQEEKEYCDENNYVMRVPSSNSLSAPNPVTRLLDGRSEIMFSSRNSIYDNVPESSDNDKN